MNPHFSWSEQTRQLHGGNGLQFNAWTLRWESGTQLPPQDLRAVSAEQALMQLQGQLRRVPVGVIGPREASEHEYQTAQTLGAALAEHKLQLLCGGKNGVMEAAAKGHLQAGGTPIGLIPETDWRASNPYICIPIATGIGKSRNVIIAQSCPVLIAVGGGYGTMSEIAFGLHFEHLVLSLCDAPPLPGVVACASVQEAIHRTAEHLLQLPDAAVKG